MAKMTLQAVGVNGGAAYSFPNDPRGCPRVRKVRRVGGIRTFESHAVFDWGFKGEQSGFKGLRRVLRWPAVRLDFYDMMQSFYETANAVTWNPQAKAHTPAATYVVSVIGLRGQRGIPHTHIRNVELELEIVTVN